jgi:integrase
VFNQGHCVHGSKPGFGVRGDGTAQLQPGLGGTLPAGRSPPVTVHDARRTCASLLVDPDVHPRVAMQILRHADFSITMEIYSKISSKRIRDALKQLGESLDRR